MFGHTNEPVTLERDVTAIIIPIGEAVTLREGTPGFITQALGGSFTVFIDGNLFRIAGQDADALGKEPVEAPRLPPDASRRDVEELDEEQEEVLVGDRKLLLVAFLLLNHWTVDQIVSAYDIDDLEMVRLLARLDRLKIIDLLP